MFRSSRRLLLAALVVLATAMPPLAQAAVAPDAARSFIADLAERATAILNGDASLDQRRAELRELLQEGFDVAFIARAVLGPPYRDLTEAQRDAYVEAFERWVIATYATRLDDYTGQRVEIMGAEPQGNQDARVTSRVVGGSETVRIDWRVRERSSGLQIIDIEVEGVSMTISQRNEFNAVVQRRGVDGLIELLRERAGPLI